MKYIASWSGGKDSTASIILAHENNEPLDLIIFSEVMYDKETSGELPEHIDFIKNKCIPLFESWGYETKILHSDLTYMDIFLREPTRGKRFGSGLITGFPMAGRCQINKSVKILPITKFLKGFKEEFTQYVGIATDEPKRLKKLENTNRISLLAKYGYTEQMAYGLCRKYGLLSPIYGFSKRGGCWFCPNASEKELWYLRKNHKDLWDRLLELENTPNLIGKIWNSLTKTSIHDVETKFSEEENRMKGIEKIPKDCTHFVEPYDEKEIDRHFKALDKAVKAYKKSFIDIALNLYWLDDTGSCYYANIDGVTYRNIAEYASDRYGISRATTYQYLAVIKKFGKINPDTGFIDRLDDRYKDYGSTALMVMAGMDDMQLMSCKPDMKINELKALCAKPSGKETGTEKPEKNNASGSTPESTPDTGTGGSIKEDNDSLPLEPKPKKEAFKNSQKLFEIESAEDLKKRSKSIMESIKKVLSQNNGTDYHVDIYMTWD